MGKVFTPEQVRHGEVPPLSGINQLMAARAIFAALRNYNQIGNLELSHLAPPELLALQEFFRGELGESRNHRSFEIAFQGYGSSFTGNARRRGEVDMAVGYARLESGLYVRARSEEEVIQQNLFVQNLEKMIETITARFQVESDVHYISLVDAQENTSDMADDGLFLDHIANASPHNRLGDVLQNLRQHAIDITQPLEEWQKAEILRIALGYMAVKAEFFAGGLQWLNNPDDNDLCFEAWGEGNQPRRMMLEPELLRLEILRRALEFAKAAARKIMAVGVVDDIEPVHTDVTSRPDMYRQFHAAARIIDRSGELTRDHQRLIQLDGEYDSILEQALEKQNTRNYERWLGKQIMGAVETAYRLAASCHSYIEAVIENKELVAADFSGYYEEKYRLVGVNETGVSGPVRLSSK